MADTSSRLFKLVQERATSMKEAEERKKKQEQNLKPYIPKDCVSNILIRLPLQSLQRSRFVCKPWYKLINAPKFIDTHLSLSQNTLIFVSIVVTHYNPFIPIELHDKPNTFSIEDKICNIECASIFRRPMLNPRSIFKIQYMEIREGKSKIFDYNATCLGQIRASCNGVIILDNKLKKGGLVALNPVTRKIIILPSGTIYPSHEESFALAFCSSKKQFKLVHLFRDELQYIGCEILDFGTRSWREIDGPSFELLTWFGYNPVHAIGAIHWVPHIDHNEYIVSISIENEIFHKIPLPVSGRTRDRIVEIGGLLGFVAHVEMNRIDVWVLRSLCGEEWTRQHSIVASPFSFVCLVDMFCVCCTAIDGELIFRSEKDGSIYAYARDGAMRKVETEKGLNLYGVCFLPHVNSLVSWETHGEGESMDE